MSAGADSPEALASAREGYARWANDAREAMEAAGIDPPPWPADLMNDDDMATAALASVLLRHRWLLSFDPEMRLHLKPVPHDAYVLPACEFAHAIADIGFPAEYLGRVVGAATGRRARRILGAAAAGKAWP